MKMRNLKLRPGATWADPRDFVHPKIDELRTAYYTFSSNLSRAHSLATMISNIIVPTIIIERAEIGAEEAIEAGLAELRAKPGMENYSYPDEVRRKMLDKWIDRELNKYYDHLSEYEEGKEFLFGEHIDRAYYYIQHIAERRPQTMEAINAHFCNQMTEVWTSFEVLSVDLWAGAIESIPDMVSDANKPKILRMIKHGGLEETIKAYKETFSSGGDEIMEAVTDPSIDLLLKARNIIIHSGAKFTQKYLDDVKSYESAPRGPVGSPLQLDGDIVHSLLSSVVKQCGALIKAVDKWLVTHRSS